MSQPERFRYRISFSKNGPFRFTSHLDLHRAWERTFRRADLPLVYSEGFNPRPKIQLSPALPLGFTSTCELVDVWLESRHSSEDLLKELRNASPPGLEVQDVQSVLDDEPALQNQVVAARYDVRFDFAPDRETLRAAVDELMAQDSLPRERRGKLYDLRPLIESLIVPPDEESECRLRMQLSAREGATGRPEEVLRALNLDPHQVHIRRTQLIFESEGS